MKDVEINKTTHGLKMLNQFTNVNECANLSHSQYKTLKSKRFGVSIKNKVNDKH